MYIAADMEAAICNVDLPLYASSLLRDWWAFFQTRR